MWEQQMCFAGLCSRGRNIHTHGCALARLCTNRKRAKCVNSAETHTQAHRHTGRTHTHTHIQTHTSVTRRTQLCGMSTITAQSGNFLSEEHVFVWECKQNEHMLPSDTLKRAIDLWSSPMVMAALWDGRCWWPAKTFLLYRYGVNRRRRAWRSTNLFERRGCSADSWPWRRVWRSLRQSPCSCLWTPQRPSPRRSSPETTAARLGENTQKVKCGPKARGQTEKGHLLIQYIRYQYSCMQIRVAAVYGITGVEANTDYSIFIFLFYFFCNKKQIQ